MFVNFSSFKLLIKKAVFVKKETRIRYPFIYAEIYAYEDYETSS